MKPASHKFGVIAVSIGLRICEEVVVSHHSLLHNHLLGKIIYVVICKYLLDDQCSVFPANTGFIRECAALVSVACEFDFLATISHLKYLMDTNPFVYMCSTI